LSAHVTLFHALPGEHLESIERTLQEVCKKQRICLFETYGVRFLGRGTAYDLHMDQVVELRQSLAMVWSNFLTPQDRSRFRPHVTVQNKADLEQAKALFSRLKTSYVPWHGHITGLVLNKYLGGAWETISELSFPP
jgi:hypothetical protein